MVKQVFILILFFYLMSLFQTTFLVPFGFFNFILFLVIFLNLFEKQEKNFGLISSLVAGFFLDVFSTKPFGSHILILFFLSLFIKMVLRRYIQLPVFFKYDSKL